jgi:4-hydroxy-tetrahydrodipicolinate synthase
MVTRWNGIFAALWTPTDANGELVREALRDNLRFLLRARIHGILALGSTGEFLFLKLKERRRFLQMVIEEAGSTPVIANISDIRPKAVADLGRFAKETGAAAVSVLPPYFFPVSQADLVEFFARAGEAAGLPLILYNFPERTGNRIALETVAAVADRVPLVAIKQSGAEFDYHRELAALGREKNFAVITGADTRLPEAMKMGVSGCVSGLSNAVPDLMVDIYRQLKSEAPDGAITSAAKMDQIGNIVDTLEFPQNVAALMEARGLAVGAPKSIISNTTRERYEKLVEQFRDLFRQWKLI